jgi:signal transduction histidine kinase
MTSAVTLAQRPAESRGRRSTLAEELIVAFGVADDLDSALSGAVVVLRRWSEAARVEWWTIAEDGCSSSLAAAEGRVSREPRVAIPIGAADVVVVSGARDVGEVRRALARLEPVVRRRRSEARMASLTMRLLRRCEALDDFAALVAHELKNTLGTALLERDPMGAVARAVEIVDAILEAAHAEPMPGASADVRACLQAALHDLGSPVTAETLALPKELPLAPTVLRIIFRNLIANAAAAGARHVKLSAVQADGCWSLVVDDDGVGIDATQAGRYATGSRLGLGLCRRILERSGGLLELAPKLDGGTRATLLLTEAGAT